MCRQDPTASRFHLARNKVALFLCIPEQALWYETPQSLDDPRYYLNRHVQWLEFNRRVLEEARDPGNPLLERVKFLAITANNLDEFVEVRVSSFLQRIEHGSTRAQPGRPDSTEEELATGHAGHARLGPRPVQVLERRAAAAAGQRIIRVLRFAELDAKGAKVREEFLRPARCADADAGDRRSFASVSARAEQSAVHFLSCCADAWRKWQTVFRRGDGAARAAAAVAACRRADDAIHYVSLQEIISDYAPKLYRGYEILASAPFRITRNSNLYLEEEETRNLLEAIDSQVAQRRKGWAVRLEIEAGAQPEIVRAAGFDV